MLRVAALLAVTALTACSKATDLGRPCTMTTRGPDGGRVALLVGQLDGGDAVAFEGKDCESLTCVRDPQSRSADPYAVAVGYCSVHCQQGAPCESENPANPLQCRRLNVPRETWQPTCLDGEPCRTVFAQFNDFYACARAGDGGP